MVRHQTVHLLIPDLTVTSSRPSSGPRGAPLPSATPKVEEGVLVSKGYKVEFNSSLPFRGGDKRYTNIQRSHPKTCMRRGEILLSLQEQAEVESP